MDDVSATSMATPPPSGPDAETIPTNRVAGDDQRGADPWAEVVGQRPLPLVLRQVVAAARRAVPSAVEASITVIGATAVVTVAFDGAGAVALDERQYEHGVGPCLDAAEQARTVRVDSTADGTTAAGVYPAFCHAARRAGVEACLAVPLGPSTMRPAAALNLYGVRTFSTEEQRQVEAFCLRVSVLVLNAAHWHQMKELVQQLQDALAGRAVIEQAKGMLMLRHGCSAEEAFDELRTRSRDGNQKLRDVAAETSSRLLSQYPPPSWTPPDTSRADTP